MSALWSPLIVGFAIATAIHALAPRLPFWRYWIAGASLTFAIWTAVYA